MSNQNLSPEQIKSLREMAGTIAVSGPLLIGVLDEVERLRRGLCRSCDETMEQQSYWFREAKRLRLALEGLVDETDRSGDHDSDAYRVARRELEA